jgi:hypothetical protein
VRVVRDAGSRHRVSIAHKSTSEAFSLFAKRQLQRPDFARRSNALPEIQPAVCNRQTSVGHKPSGNPVKVALVPAELPDSFSYQQAS